MRTLLISSFVVGAALIACDDPSIPPLGDLEVSAIGQAANLQTADGWLITADRFLVHVNEVTVAGDDGLVAGAGGPMLLDFAVPGPQTVLAARHRTVRPWEAVSLRIGPIGEETELELESPFAEDIPQVRDAQLSIWIRGRATRGPQAKTFEWGFTTDTIHEPSAEDRGGQRGVVVTPATRADYTLTVTAAALFTDRLCGAAGEPVVRFDAIAAADADANGVVTLEELRAVSLEDARATGAAYDVGSSSEIVDLGGFVDELSRHIVATSRGVRACSARPAEP